MGQRPLSGRDGVRGAARIVLAYATFAMLWIYLSDTGLSLLVRDPSVITRLSVVKGAFFVLVTSILLSVLVTRFLRRTIASSNALAESDARFRSYVESAPVAVLVFDEAGVCVDSNRAAEDMFGVEAAEFRGTSIDHMVPRESRARLAEDRGRLKAEGFVDTEYTLQHRGGRALAVHVRAAALKDGDWIAFCQDVTEIRAAERQREAVVEILRICNEAGTTRDLVRGLVTHFRRVTGCDAVGIRLREGDDFPYFESRGFPDDFLQAESRLCASGPTGAILRRADGRAVLDCMCGVILSGETDTAKPWFTRNGSFWTSSTTKLLDTAGMAEQKTLYRNRCNTAGYESVALLPLRAGGEPLGLLQLNARAAGKFTAETIGHLEAQVSYAAIALSKLRADEALREAAQFSQQVFDSAEEGIIVYDGALRYVRFNPFMERLTGMAAAEVIGRLPGDLFPYLRETGASEHAARALQGTASTISEMRYLIPRNGREGWTSHSYAPLRNAAGQIVGVIVTVREITERKRAELQLQETNERLLHAEKMEAVGRLAGGVAHDFNNILTAIYGYCELLLARGPGPAMERSHVEEIQKAAQRAASLTQQLLAFSRRQTLRPVEADLNRLIRDLQTMLRRLIGENIDIQIDLHEGLWPVLVDPSRVEQVLVNLAVNARDAMHAGGVLRIATRNSPPTAQEPREMVAVSVQDTGTGMDEATLAHLFEPFFTTKGQGKGTGLGLSTVYGIVSQSGGTITVESAPAKGTTFVILLPRSALAAGPAAAPAPARSPAHGTETLLYVEDDADVRGLMSMVLRGSGYTVIVAADGEEALRLASPHVASLALVITDLVMPRMGGRELAAALARIRPDLPVLFMSGYTEESLAGMTGGGSELIEKPVNPDTLLLKIREVIERRAGLSGRDPPSRTGPRRG